MDEDGDQKNGEISHLPPVGNLPGKISGHDGRLMGENLPFALYFLPSQTLNRWASNNPERFGRF